MKILITIVSIFFAVAANAQDVKRIYNLSVSLNNQHPDKFILEDDFVKITYKGQQLQSVDFNIYNKLEKSIDIVWLESYFVLNSVTERADNMGVSKTSMGAFGGTPVDNMKDQKIGPQSSVVAKMAATKLMFNDTQAKKHYKSTGETLVNRAVIALRINDEVKEYPITIELYTKDQLKKLKGE